MLIYEITKSRILTANHTVPYPPEGAPGRSVISLLVSSGVLNHNFSSDSVMLVRRSFAR